ncbi:MAG TPA: serine/threonine-protein kinase [Kofleriaceae bacterium]|nr:serine/threonine-protein kinase [Kofleriaceae bacterium]
MPYTFDHDTFDGRRPNAERDPLIGTALDDRYRIEERIATGGFGAIYRARTASGETVALKILHARFTGDPTMVARFRREGAILTRLHDPHTVTTLAVGETRDGMLYIAMELLSGESLEHHLHRAGALPWQTAAAIARAVCSSLAEAHALGVVHRDLKPANIHVESRSGSLRAVKVIDFGIVKIARGSSIDDGNDLTCAGHMIGTNDYMSPEQLLGAPCTGASDLYSLGVVLYEMLTGRLPHPRVAGPEAMITAIVTQTPMRPSMLAAIPPELDRIVMRCLERERAARYDGVVELARDLDRLLALRVAPHDEVTVTYPAWHTVRDDRAWGEAASALDEPGEGPKPRGSRPKHGTLPGVAVAPERRSGELGPPRALGDPRELGRSWADAPPTVDATPPRTALRFPPLRPWLLPPLVPPEPGSTGVRALLPEPAPPPPHNDRLWWLAVAILAGIVAASLAVLFLA